MRRSIPPLRLQGRLVLLLVLALAATTAAVAAVPAAADPVETTLDLSAQSLSVNWHKKGVLNGVLRTTAQPPVPVDGQDVVVEFSRSPTAGWDKAGMAEQTLGLYGTGAYTYSWPAERTYYWRMVFAATTGYAGQTSAAVLVKVKAVVGKPACPRSVRAGKRFVVSGTLKPKFPKGAKTVTVRAKRYSGGKWRPYRNYKATNANSGSFSKYTVKIKITRKGRYRFVGTSAASGGLASGKSRYSRTLRVK